MNPANRKGIARRAQVLEFIARFIAEHGYSPTYREIQKSVGLMSYSTVLHHIRCLTKEGKLIYEPGLPRTIRLVENGRKDIPELDCACGRHIIPEPGAVQVNCGCGKVYRLYLGKGAGVIHRVSSEELLMGGDV